ncbi:hypothetical protein K443DRAFT_9430 [Laccaria amethystina LaAM-08-1]|uniref:Unplaced genomic scaffold K443scaffold_142, whole genome shotgun sequence n=1 Tax=Laccaria amethystina LaAM-08-1 TaxID=1095629 RepID=A0A0C9X9J0_9AGAR|nr:hypothetical protein K443DRAFT_9430 [Laccaria amethystina LaAM-08-1]
MTMTATVVVPHKPHHQQTADVARQWSIWVCHINDNSQEDEQDPTAADFEDQAKKERGKGATGGQGNKGPAAARTTAQDPNHKDAALKTPPRSEQTAQPYPRTPQQGTMTTPLSTNGNDHRCRWPPPFTNVDRPRVMMTPT